MERTCNSRVVQAASDEDVRVFGARLYVINRAVGLHVVVVLLVGRISPLLPLPDQINSLEILHFPFFTSIVKTYITRSSTFMNCQ